MSPRPDDLRNPFVNRVQASLTYFASPVIWYITVAQVPLSPYLQAHSAFFLRISYHWPAFEPRPSVFMRDQTACRSGVHSSFGDRPVGDTAAPTGVSRNSGNTTIRPRARTTVRRR